MARGIQDGSGLLETAGQTKNLVWCARVVPALDCAVVSLNSKTASDPRGTVWGERTNACRKRPTACRSVTAPACLLAIPRCSISTAAGILDDRADHPVLGKTRTKPPHSGQTRFLACQMSDMSAPACRGVDSISGLKAAFYRMAGATDPTTTPIVSVTCIYTGSPASL